MNGQIGHEGLDATSSTPLAIEQSGWSKRILPPDHVPDRTLDSRAWAEAVFEPVALIGALVCFVLGIVGLGLAIVPSWDTSFIAPLTALVGIEAFVYARGLDRPRFVARDWLVFLVGPLVLARFLPYLVEPNTNLATDVQYWWSNPGSFFTLAFLSDASILLLSWSVIYVCTQYLNQLRVQPGELTDPRPSSIQPSYDDSIRALDHSEPLRQLGRIYLVGGVLLVVLGAIASIGTQQLFSFSAISQLIGFQRPSTELVLANVLLYFLLGLALLGEGHFVRQRTLWRLDHIPIPNEVENRWIGSVVALVLVSAIIAFILPTSYAMTLGDLISGVIYLVVEAIALVAAGVFYVMYLISSLFPHHSGPPQAPPSFTPPHPPPTAAPPPGGSPFDTIRSLIFWAVALGIILYSLSVYWRRRGGLPIRLPLSSLLRLPLLFLRGLLRLVGRVGREVAEAVARAVPSFLRQAAPAVTRPLRLVSLARMDPRQRVEYFYLSICERAAQLGHPRAPGTTPDEYEAMLRHELPVVEPEMTALTEAFVEARYGPRLVSADQAQATRGRWQTLKVKLRQARLRRGPRPS
ncbi:MAG TPA: DUF4129 domain-containing protein [Chloroflexota bacterium]|nr:DUF4129 domain-containing protein [Chloroflexota bacterium]